jgi:uncharacterized membrane protein
MKYFKAYFVAAATFLVVDLAWIGLFLRNVYDDQLGSMMLANPRVAGAVIFYVAYVAAIVYLAIRPAWQAESSRTALLNGGSLGAIAYGTYTLTNFALFEAWSWLLVVSDVAWGGFLTAVAALAGYLASRR